MAAVETEVTAARRVEGAGLDLSDASVLDALQRAMDEIGTRFPGQPTESYEVTNVLLGRDSTMGEPVEPDPSRGDLIRVGRRLGELAKQGLVARRADGGWATAKETTDAS